MKKLTAFGICAIMLATNFSGTAAEARVSKARFDSASAGCGAIQDELDRVIRAFKRAKTRAEANRLRRQGHGLVRDWNALGCSASFGNWWHTSFDKRWQRRAVRVKSASKNAPKATTKSSRRKSGRLKIRRLKKRN